MASDILTYKADTIDDIRSRSTQRQRFYAWLLATFAGIALALAVVGVFGVMSYTVTQRAHEIGIRMAVGAHPGDVLLLILRRGVGLTLIGLVIGLGGALGLARFLESWLSGMRLNEVKPTDPATLAVVSLLLAAVALLACLIPARRAAHTDPVAALRCE